MKNAIVFCLCASVLLLASCDDRQPTAVVSVPSAEPAIESIPAIEDSASSHEMVAASPLVETSNLVSVAAPENQEQETQEGEKNEQERGGILGRAGKFLERATESSGSGAEAAKKWFSDKLQGAGESTAQSTADAGKWAEATYQMLKEKGLTTAGSVGEWLSTDIRNMEAFEYKVVYNSLVDPSLQKKLNQLGSEGWECVTVQYPESNIERSESAKAMFLFKKSSTSYLKSIPFKELLPLIPLMGEDTGTN